MLSEQDNQLLTRVGRGTPMGNLLRRYWMPALLSSEIPEPDCAPIRVRLLGEDLIAIRDTSGVSGLFANACPHRGASMFFGRNEEDGLRCVYHGWKFDVAGTCVDMPSEPAESNFKSKVRIGTYPTRKSGGIIWAYMGPSDKQPEFRDYGQESLPREMWRASKILSYCNWVQGLEGNIDSVHSSFLHRSLRDRGEVPDDSDRPGYPTPAMSTFIKARTGGHGESIELQDTWYGFKYAGIRPTMNGHRHARVTNFMLPFMCYIGANPVGGDSCLMMVPRDDNTYWRMNFVTKIGVSDRSPLTASGAAGRNSTLAGGIQERAALPENDYLIDREMQRNVSFTGIVGIAQQDLCVTESMGEIYDRTHEYLGTTDRAVIRMRRLLMNAARDLEKGIEPPAVAPGLDWKSIRSAEKILEAGEDWRILGTEDDPFLRGLVAPSIPA